MSFSMGEKCLKISANLFSENRRRLVNALQKKVGRGNVILLQGGREQNRYNTDSMDLPFRQESYFFWAFGVHESDCYGIIDVDSGTSMLLPPRLNPDFAIWQGRINTEKWFKQKYEVDEVHFNGDNATISKILVGLRAKVLLLLKAGNSDSGDILEAPELEELKEFRCDTSTLYPIIAELRVFKTDAELDVMRYVCKVSSDAHKAAMKATKPGMYEYQIESVFRHHCYFNGGCRHLAYTCIASSGCNAAILHYGHANAPNNKQIADNELCLLDMGAEYNCYASDITITYPSIGKFTEEQKIIYNAVLAANRAVFNVAKPGVKWTTMHCLAERELLTHLSKAGILKGDIDEMLEARIGGIFMPHGLGHFLGLDVHDCGGYIGDAEPRATSLGLRSLRTTRTLQERMVITIEPGCYFIDVLLDSALNDARKKHFFNVNRLNAFRSVGGVRIEDDIVIWNDGNELMSSDIPRTVVEIEAFMAQ